MIRQGATVINWSGGCGPGVVAETVNVCVTEGAAANVELPGWLAVIEQVPVPSKVATIAVTVQTAGLFDVNVTGSPELAVALNGSDPVARV
jgi:hypothetical protein